MPEVVKFKFYSFTSDSFCEKISIILNCEFHSRKTQSDTFLYARNIRCAISITNTSH